jgi:hypothetical protein
MKSRRISKRTHWRAPNRRVPAASNSLTKHSQHGTNTPSMTPLWRVNLTTTNAATVDPVPMAHSQSGEIPKG